MLAGWIAAKAVGAGGEKGEFIELTEQRIQQS